MKHCHWIMYDSEVEPAWAIEDYNEFQWHIEVSPLIRCWNTASYLSKHEAQSLDWEKKTWLRAVYAISSPTPSSYIKVAPRSLRSSKVLSIHKKENAGEEKKNPLWIYFPADQTDITKSVYDTTVNHFRLQLTICSHWNSGLAIQKSMNMKISNSLLSVILLWIHMYP